MNDLTHYIAAKCKTLRAEKGWSLDQTALHTGVSKAMLGQIERAESNPTVLTLWKIALGFQSSLSYFLPKETVVQPTLSHETEPLSVRLIQPYNEQIGYEILLVRLEAYAQHASCAHAAGVSEDLLPLNGALKLQLQTALFLVQPGENLRFAADQTHLYLNPNPFELQFYNIVHYAKLHKDS